MKPRIILFGASKGGLSAIEDLSPKAKIVAFSDNDPTKHGSRFNGIPIVAPNQINDLSPDGVVISSMYSEDIYHQLIEMGYPANRILIHGVVASQIRPRYPWDAVFFLGAMIMLVGIACLILLKSCVVS